MQPIMQRTFALVILGNLASMAIVRADEATPHSKAVEIVTGLLDQDAIFEKPGNDIGATVAQLGMLVAEFNDPSMSRHYCDRIRPLIENDALDLMVLALRSPHVLPCDASPSACGFSSEAHRQGYLHRSLARDAAEGRAWNDCFTLYAMAQVANNHLPSQWGDRYLADTIELMSLDRALNPPEVNIAFEISMQGRDRHWEHFLAPLQGYERALAIIGRAKALAIKGRHEESQAALQEVQAIVDEHAPRQVFGFVHVVSRTPEAILTCLLRNWVPEHGPAYFEECERVFETRWDKRDDERTVRLHLDFAVAYKRGGFVAESSEHLAAATELERRRGAPRIHFAACDLAGVIAADGNMEHALSQIEKYRDSPNPNVQVASWRAIRDIAAEHARCNASLEETLKSIRPRNEREEVWIKMGYAYGLLRPASQLRKDAGDQDLSQ